MKKFKEFDKSKSDDSEETPSRDNIANVIANSLNRLGGKDDSKTMLTLIAALGLLNTNKDGLPLSVARRLATTIKK
jgi:hypothetical protein